MQIEVAAEQRAKEMVNIEAREEAEQETKEQQNSRQDKLPNKT